MPLAAALAAASSTSTELSRWTTNNGVLPSVCPGGKLPGSTSHACGLGSRDQLVDRRFQVFAFLLGSRALWVSAVAPTLGNEAGSLVHTGGDPGSNGRRHQLTSGTQMEPICPHLRAISASLSGSAGCLHRITRWP